MEHPGITLYMISAMASVALADEKLTQREKEALVQVVSAYKRGLLTPPEILDQVEQTISMLLAGGAPLLQEILSGGRHLPAESKSIVIDAAGTMAFVDGEPGSKEIELTVKIARWIGMDRPAFDRWAQEFQHELDRRKGTPT
ncbi:MAG TPA: TerB family tellurite resistance protein [Thermoanaerobaculia bacterium]|nr:TerB family tellurite resistance protein [Thermoanaerobaculia bacterium]